MFPKHFGQAVYFFSFLIILIPPTLNSGTYVPYDLSINKYKEIEYIPVEYPPTSEILAELDELQMQISKELAELRTLLGEE